MTEWKRGRDIRREWDRVGEIEIRREYVGQSGRDRE